MPFTPFGLYSKGHSDLSSFCTKICGYLGALYALRALLQACLPPINSLVDTTIHIDNLGVVQRSSNAPFLIQQYLLLDWDIFNKATQVRHSIHGVIKVQHVKSHQDHNTNTPETLPLPARLNILVDAGTHQAYTDCPSFCQTPFLPTTPVALVINNNLITSNHLSSTSLAYYTPIMSMYFKEKHCWSKETFLSIDWLTSDKEYKRLPTGRRLASFKLQNRLWPTYSVLHQWKPAHSPTCPRCCLDPETHNHVLCCPQAQTTWLQQWCTVVTILKSTLKTPCPIYNTLEHGIRSWQEGDPDPQWPFPLPSNSDPIEQVIFLAYTKQSSIGWSHTLSGHLCLHWGAAMFTYMQYRAPYNTFKPTQLVRTLIQTLC